MFDGIDYSLQQSELQENSFVFHFELTLYIPQSKIGYPGRFGEKLHRKKVAFNMKNKSTSLPSKNNHPSGAIDLPPLIFNIGAAGKFSGPMPLEVSIPIKSFFHDLLDVVKPYQQNRYGFSESESAFNLLYAPAYCDLPFDQIAPDPYTPYCIRSRENDEQPINLSSSKAIPVELNLPASIGPCANNELINWMMEQSDLFFTLWDGTKEYDQGSIWDLILQADTKRIPVIWLNPAKPDQLFFRREGINLLYEHNSLENYCREVLGLNDSSEKIAELKKLTGVTKIHKNFGSGFYRRFANQFKKFPSPPSKDDLLVDQTNLPPELAPFEEKYNTMKYAYKKADWISMIENGNYRSALLFRGFLPFLANFVLIFGFYGKNILGTSKFF